MHKKEFVARLAERAVLTKTQANEALNVMMALIKETVDKEGQIRLDGFGTFERYVRSGHRGRNSMTGEIIEIPSCPAIRFKAAKAWKRRLEESEE